MLTSEVRDWNGSPAMFIDGSPDSGLMFFHNRIKNAGREIAGFGASGVHFVTFPVMLCLPDRKGQYDFSVLDSEIRGVLDASPSALIMPRCNLYPPQEWIEKHPDECELNMDPLTGELKPTRLVSMSSVTWKECAGPALEQLIDHLEQKWGSHILGYHLAGGEANEWSWSWSMVLSDFSPAHRSAWRKWLCQRYNSDLTLLRQAWNNPEAQFETAEVPGLRERCRGIGNGALLDPAQERRTIDYQTFLSESAAESAIWFCSLAKRKLAGLSKCKVCGVFYGYHFWNVDRPAWFHNSGHHALSRLLSSPDIDFICAPIFYQQRFPGGSYLSQLPTGSIRANGKLFYSEDDTRTWLANPGDAVFIHQCRDRAETLDTLRRNLMGAIADGGTGWFMDLIGTGWYNDTQFFNDIGDLKKLADHALSADRKSCADIAVIVSKESAPYFRYDAVLTDALLSRQMMELAHSGAQFDVFLASDISKVFASPEARKYRLVIFLDAFHVPPAQRNAIRELLARDGRTLLWIHAAGLITDKGFSIESASELTGFTLQADSLTHPQSITVETCLTGQRLTYGVGAPVAPALWGDDPKAQILGWLSQPYKPGLLSKQFGGYRSIWSAAPTLPSSLLWAIYGQAGVHAYCQTGDQVIRTSNLLMIHSAIDGVRTIHLPQRMTVRDMQTDAVVAENAAEFQLDLQRGRTWMGSIQ